MVRRLSQGVVIALLAIGAAGAEERTEPLSTAVLAQLGAMRDHGQIAGVHLAASPSASPSFNKKLIVMIQDVHADYDTQKQIAALLEDLISSQRLRLILAEGGSGDISVARLRQYRTPESRQELAERYLKSGVFAGHEYVDLVSDAPLMLWGIEDAGLYAQNVERFLDVERLRQTTGPQLALLRRAIEPAVATRLSPSAHAFVERGAQFDDATLKTEDYLAYLWEEAERLKVARSAYPALEQFARMTRLGQWDSDVDLAALFGELHRLRQELAPRLAASPEERRWLELLDVLGSLERLMRLEWAPEDLRAFHAKPARYAMSAWGPFLKEQGLAWDGQAASLDEALAVAVRFYETAEERNAEMVRRSLEKMEAEDQPLAALILGGFHADELSRQFAEVGAQVVVVTLSGGASHDAAHYHDVLKAKYRASTLRQGEKSR